MNPCVDDDEFPGIENEFVYTEGDTMADEGGCMTKAKDG
jgi:hypothetical protein